MRTHLIPEEKNSQEKHFRRVAGEAFPLRPTNKLNQTQILALTTKQLDEVFKILCIVELKHKALAITKFVTQSSAMKWKLFLKHQLI